MVQKLISVAALSGFAAFALFGVAHGQGATPNLSGTYRCEGPNDQCMWTGETLTVTQNGDALEVKNEKGVMGVGKVTSAISVSMGPPWNSPGILMDNNRTIEWSNGNKWMKQ